MPGMRILVLGAGGTGGYFGGRLAEAGADVTFLVREHRAAQLHRDGLRVESPFGNLELAPKVIAARGISEPFDVVLVGCKAYDLDRAIEAIRPAVGPETAVLPILNGIGHMDELNAAFGRHSVLGGTAKIQVTLRPDGVVHHLNDWRFIVFGEQDGRQSGRVAALAAEFAPARGVVAEGVQDIGQRMWEKLVHIATSATMTCLMRANVGEIVRTEEGKAMLLRLLSVNATIAARNGHAPGDAFMETYRATFSDPDSHYSTSMLRDMERGAPTEGEQIIGHMCRQARALGISEPILGLALTHVQAYDQRRRASRL